MNRIEKKFTSAKDKNKKCLISYITGGDPDLETSLEVMHTLVSSGTDIIELGVPFSDPIADGPVIQRACERALSQNTSCKDILKLITLFREKDDETPIVLMGYLNPIEIMGYENFSEQAHSSGADGVLVVDLPYEEASEIVDIFRSYNLDSIFLVAPNTKNERIEKIMNFSSGFLYYVSLKGVTGAPTLNLEETLSKLDKIKKFTKLPLAVGFGINDPESARLLSKHADAVVVGSAIIKIIEKNINNRENICKGISSLLLSIRSKLDEGG